MAHVDHIVSTKHVLQATERLGLDELGLDRVEQTIVRFLARIGRPIGAETLASRLGLDLQIFRDVHEPWLERAGLVERTERGRIATAEARALYGPGSAADAARRRPASAGPGARAPRRPPHPDPAGAVPALMGERPGPCARRGPGRRAIRPAARCSQQSGVPRAGRRRAPAGTAVAWPALPLRSLRAAARRPAWLPSAAGTGHGEALPRVAGRDRTPSRRRSSSFDDLPGRTRKAGAGRPRSGRPGGSSGRLCGGVAAADAWGAVERLATLFIK